MAELTPVSASPTPSPLPPRRRRRASSRRRFRRGQVILAPGQELDELHFVEAGLVAVGADTDGRFTGSVLLGPECVIAINMALGYSTPFARCVALTQVRTRALGGEELARDVSTVGGVLRAPLHQLTARLLTRLTSRAGCASRHTADQRIAAFLLEGMTLLSSATVPVIHEGVADLLGLRRATVTSTLDRWRNAGALRIRRGAISVLDPASIGAIACDCPRDPLRL